MDDNNGEHNKKAYHESINFAMQGMGENAQFLVAIAVGIFGILAIFATIDDYDEKEAQDIFGKTALWTHPLSIQIIGIVLSIAYWALVLFGIQSYVSRRYLRFGGIQDRIDFILPLRIHFIYRNTFSEYKDGGRRDKYLRIYIILFCKGWRISVIH
jgi:hypothetical protein